jgi:hypothetical protein
MAIADTFIYDSPDDKLLRTFVTSAVKVVSAIVNGDAPLLLPPQRVFFTHPEAQKWFQHNWNGFKEAADRVVGSLRNIAGKIWEKLHNAGLTLGHLKMKWQLLYQDLLTGKFSNILRRLDSILKSLASAIDLAECLAEYKEHVELTIDKLQDLNVGDCTELIDLDLAS